jgi:BirA family biotin operon repressor/biotin-[acetyl-CoA-carboxylase] ligase
MNKFDLLELLKSRNKNENKYISGEIIAEKFNVTRAAVWKVITGLKNDGYEIESKTNKGYKLLKSFDVLNEYEIKSRLQNIKNKNLDSDFAFDVIYKKITESTNTDAKKIAGNKNVIIAANEQSAGRGRYGRSFSSRKGGLYFTVKICRNNYNKNNITNNYFNNYFKIEDITFYPLIMAVAASRAVYDLCGIDLYMKWPNDLLYKSDTEYKSYKKVAGILTEASIQAENREIAYIIAGIGINVNTSEFDEEIKDIASSLKIIAGKDFDRADLLCAITENFMELVNSSHEHLLGEYKKRLLTGVNISFAQNGSEYKGMARGINESGNLLAEVDGKLMTVQSGEIHFV